MLRDNLISKHQADEAFRWRSHEITRIEGFSDAVFGFAVTLLIVSLEVPHTSTELLATMAGFGSFVATFVVLASIWYAQFVFFRRYAMEDSVTVVLNLALLFTVLFFAYPLKFLFGVMIGHPSALFRPGRHGEEAIVLPEHRPLIFFIFAFGFIAVFTVFVLLYQHAWRKREVLGLNEFESFETKHAVKRMIAAIWIGASYFGLGGLFMLPRGTPAQKRILLSLDLLFIAIITFLMVRMIRLARERKKHRDEYLRSLT